MTITQGRILFISAFLTTQAFMVQGQAPLTAKVSGNVEPRGVAAENDSDRARDGLTGPVRRIRSEVVKVSNADGKLIENGKRVLLETAEYDLKGAKTVNQYFPVAGAAPTGREVYKYDDKGNISEMTLTAPDESLISKEVYKYEYDSLGNWTKMTTSVAVVENGTINFEPSEVTYRTISYYLDATMTRMLANSSSTPASSSQNQTSTSASNRSSSEKPSAAPTMVAALTIPRYVPVHFTGQPTQAIVSDVRNLSLALDQKVTVENAPPPPVRPSRAPVSGGVLNGAAVSLPAPVYPETARRMSMSGTVEVEVVIDENGKVVSAKAISGPPTLRDSAVRAALRARFTPSKLSGQPVQVTGKIVYKFAPFQ